MLVWIKRNILRILLIKCVIFTKYTNTLKVIKTIFVDAKNKSFSWNKREYAIDLTKSFLDQKNNPVLHYNFEDVFPISLTNIKNPKNHSSKLLKSLLLEKTVKGILGSSLDLLMVIVIIGLIVGIVAISIYSVFQIQSLQQTIFDLMQKLPEPPIIVNP